MRSASASALAGAAGTFLLLTGPAPAHGAFIDVAGVGAVEVHARYDTGEPMAAAQVLVYAPDNPAEAWTRGVADDEGRFIFVPDGRPGRWAIQARQAGHGAMSYFTLGEEAGQSAAVTARPGGEIGLLQRLLMVASVVWGCIGTALYFRRPRGGGRA